jgi:hypothetical protein
MWGGSLTATFVPPLSPLSICSHQSPVTSQQSTVNSAPSPIFSSQPSDWTILETMVLLLTTDHILAALETVPASRREQYNLPPKLDANGPIAHEQLIRLSKYLQSNPEPESKDTSSPASSSNPYTLNSLLRGTKVYVPPPPPKPEPVC